MKDKTITIGSFQELQDNMKDRTFSVKWKVTSEIGPGWIGSSRNIDFCLGDFNLTETEFIGKLKDKLIEVIPIPSRSNDHVIDGQGKITLMEDQLEINYKWEATIPYHYPDKAKEGTVVFFTGNIYRQSKLFRRQAALPFKKNH